MDFKMSIGDSVAITISGILIVFIALALLIVCVTLLGKLLHKSNNTPQKPEKPTVSVPQKAVQAKPAVTIEDGIGDEVVAVITAAIAAMTSGSEGTAYAVRSIKKVKTGRPAWAVAGLQENTHAF